MYENLIKKSLTWIFNPKMVYISPVDTKVKYIYVGKNKYSELLILFKLFWNAVNLGNFA